MKIFVVASCKQFTYRIIYASFFCYLTLTTFAQKKAIEFAVGPSIIHEKLPEGYDYKPIFLTAKFPIHTFKSTSKSQFNLYAEPQLVFNNAPKPFSNTFEFGVNIGIRYILPFSEKNGLMASIGVGPHYLSLETVMQAKGFIFSDNVELGYYHWVGKRWGISVKPRFRHISNAGFQSPNLGIDNVFFMAGIILKPAPM